MENFGTGKISTIWVENPSIQSLPEYSSRKGYIYWENTTIWRQKFAF